MPKPSSSRSAVRNAPQPKQHVYIPALVADDFGRLSALSVETANSWAKKKLDRASQSLQVRTERQEKRTRQTAARDWRAAMRGLEAELREADYRAKLLWRHLKTRVRPDKPTCYTPPKERKRPWPYASVALPKYDGPVIDRHGERGVFAQFRYYSRRTAGQGVSQRVILYVFNGAALDSEGNPYQYSNVGQHIDETLCAFDHLEQVNWSAQKGAKLLMHGILSVDYRQAPDEMMECGVRWAEQALGQFGLPYLVTLHAPPEDGDQRNWHLHILWSFRPLERGGDHEWLVGEMLRTDLDNSQAMKLMRELYAGVMTEVSFEVGQNQVWTAKSNADRGLPHEPQMHLGAAATNRARGGEHVAANEENHERVMRSTAAAIDDDLRHLDEALAREEATEQAIKRLWARAPAVPIRLPEPVFAAALAVSVAEMERAAPLAPPVIAPAALPDLAPAARMEADVAPPGRRPMALPEPGTVIGHELLAPTQPATIVPTTEIANLRKPLAPINYSSTPPLPVPSLRTPALKLPTLPQTEPIAPVARVPVNAAVPGRLAQVEVGMPKFEPLIAAPKAPVALPLSTARPARPATAAWLKPIGQPSQPIALADLGFIEAVRCRAADATRAADEQRSRESHAVEAAQQHRDADQLRHEMVERMFAETTAAEDKTARLAVVEQITLELLHDLNPLVQDRGRWGLSVPDNVLRMLGRDSAWQRSAPVQHVLAEMLADQNARFDRLDSAAEVAPPVAIINGRIVPAAHLPPDLKRSVERWQDDKVFKAVAQHWLASPATAAPAPSSVPVRASVARPIAFASSSPGASADAAGNAGRPHTDGATQPGTLRGISPGLTPASQTWNDARALRQRAMADADWLHRAVLPQPGTRLSQPGEARAAPETTRAPRRDWRALLSGQEREGL